MFRSRATLLSLVFVLAAGSLPAHVAVAGATVAESENRVLAPLAFVKFCMQQPAECRHVEQSTAATRAQLDALATVNHSVNNGIKPRRKVAVSGIGTWIIAPASGDCNDYAVTKRHMLLRRGWASGDLLLSDVETPWGEPHLVLAVRTSDGIFVLDNLTNDIRAVHATAYRWVRQQSPEDPNIWVSVSERPRSRPTLQALGPLPSGPNGSAPRPSLTRSAALDDFVAQP